MIVVHIILYGSISQVHSLCTHTSMIFPSQTCLFKYWIILQISDVHEINESLRPVSILNLLPCPHAVYTTRFNQVISNSTPGPPDGSCAGHILANCFGVFHPSAAKHCHLQLGGVEPKSSEWWLCLKEGAQIVSRQSTCSRWKWPDLIFKLIHLLHPTEA